MVFQNRFLLKDIEEWFNKRKAIVITGARQVGKTTIVQHLVELANDPALYLNADEPSIKATLENSKLEDLRNVVGNNKLVVIDEVQRIENAGLLLKRMVDNFKHIQIIATGSSALEISDKIFEPLTGRHILFHLYPFTLAELYKGKSTLTIEQELSFHMIYGTYPEICNLRPNAEALLKNLAGQYLYKDVLAWKDIRKPDLLDKLLQLLAFQMGSEVSLNELAKSLKVKTETVDNYIDLLEKSFVVFRLKAYASNERKEVSKMKKIYFWDNGIRNAIIGDFRPLALRQDVGALWENLMVSDRVKMNTYFHKNHRSYFWRSLQQQEVDYVEKYHDKLFAFEMKYNGDKKGRITKAFTNLYPKAVTEIITPKNIKGFCLL